MKQNKTNISVLNIAQEQTEVLINMLTEGLKDADPTKWHKGWTTNSSSFKNYVSDKSYSGGINVMTLIVDKLSNPDIEGETKSGYWVTSKQAKDFGWEPKESLKQSNLKVKELLNKKEKLRSTLNELFKEHEKNASEIENIRKEIEKVNNEIFKTRRYRDIFFYKCENYYLEKREDRYFQIFVDKTKNILYEKEVNKTFWETHKSAQEHIVSNFILKYYNILAIENFDRSVGKVIKAREEKISNKEPDTNKVQMPKEIWDKVLNPYLKRENIKCNFIKQDQAFYAPDLDKIVLPLPSQFDSEEELLATASHEFCHSTGHEKRLNRDLKNVFGSEKYCKEELVAEFGSVLFMLKFGFLSNEGLGNSLSYLRGYLDHLNKEKTENHIVYGINNAEKAVDFILKGF